MRINTNVSALYSHRQYSNLTLRVNRSAEKLSTGHRINRAADDAAGLAISEKLRTQIYGYEQANKNVQDGISMLQVADSALDTCHEIIQRIRTLAVQAANDTLTNPDRELIQLEVDQLIDELNRISTTTEFNTKKLFNRTEPVSVQIMSSSTGIIAASYPAGSWLEEGSHEVNVKYKKEITDVNTTDIVGEPVLLTDPNDFSGATTISFDNYPDGSTVNMTTINDPSKIYHNFAYGPTLSNQFIDNGINFIGGDDMLLNYSAGTWWGWGNNNITKNTIANLQYPPYASTNPRIEFEFVELGTTTPTTHNKVGLYVTGVSGAHAPAAEVYDISGNLIDTLQTANPVGDPSITFFGFYSPEGINRVIVRPSDSAADGFSIYDIKIGNSTPVPFNVNINPYLETVNTITDEVFTFILTADNDGADVWSVVGSVSGNHANMTSGMPYTTDDSGNGGGGLSLTLDANARFAMGDSFTITTTLTETAVVDDGSTATEVNPNSQGTIYKNDVEESLNVTFGSTISEGSTDFTVSETDFKLHIGPNKNQTLTIGLPRLMDAAQLGMNDCSVTTQESAELLVSKCDTAIEKVSKLRSKLGANINQLEHVYNFNGIAREEQQSAESRIRDVDFASEKIKYTKNQILMESSMAMISQANVRPRSVLSLLRQQ